MNDAATTNPRPQAPPRRRSAARWIYRLLLAAALVIVLAIGGAQIVLWSDVPRQIIVAQVQRELGLRVAAGTASTGWFGRTRLRNVTAALPLTDDAFLTMPQVDIEHTSLIRMIFGASLDLNRIELHRPQLVIREDATGRWNVIEAIDLIDRATPTRPDAPPRRLTSAAIPNLVINDGAVRVIDRAGNEARIEPVDVVGRRDGPLVYRYQARSQQQLAVTGQIVPGAGWQHVAEIRLVDIDPWLRPFVSGWAEGTYVDARWTGQVNDDGVSGRLDIESLSVADLRARGSLRASADGQELRVMPQRLWVELTRPLPQQARLESGSIVVGGNTLHVRDLWLSTAEGNIAVNGAWNRLEQSANLHAVWRELALPPGSRHSGSLTATLTTVFPSRPRIDLNLHSAAALDPGGEWEARVVARAEGPAFDDLNWTATLEQARLDWRRGVDLGGLTLNGRIRPHRVVLDDMSIPERGRLTARGELNFQEQQWWLWASGGELAYTRVGDVLVNVDVNTWGTFDGVTVDQAHISAGDVELWISGSYDHADPVPLRLSTWVTHLPELGADEADLVRGRLHGELDVAGTVAPLDLRLSGRLFGRDLFIVDHALGDIAAAVDGYLSADWMHLETHRLKLLGAEWDVTGRWPTDPRNALELIVHGAGLELSAVGDLIGEPDLRGVVSLSADMKFPSWRRDDIIADAQITATGVSMEALQAESLSATATVRDGVLTIDPIELREEDGRATGTARADLARLAEWSIRGTAIDWPIRFERPAAAVIASAEGDMQVDLERRSAVGRARLEAVLERDGAVVGNGTLQLAALGRVFQLQALHAEVFGGTVAGSGRFDMDAPLRTTANLNWSGMDAERAALWVAKLRGIHGTYEGSLTLGPTTDPRPLGPLSIELNVRSPDGGFERIAFRDLGVEAYADLWRDNEVFRVVTTRSHANVADGELRDIFLRFSLRRDQTLWLQAAAEFQRLSLDELSRPVGDDDAPLPGRLSGRMTLAGDPLRPLLLSGDVTAQLSESDLANFRPIGVLYDLMRVADAAEGPTGVGTIHGRLENRDFRIHNFYLFNRGVEVRGAGVVRNVFDIPESPLEATLVGTARPLRDMRIPFMADFDQVFSALQAYATTVEVSGTLDDPQVRTTTLDEVGDAVRVLLIGDIQRERQR